MLEVATHIRADEARAALIGELDLAAIDTLAEALTRLQATGAERIVLDLHALGFMDGTGLRAILDAQSRAEGCGKSLVLTNAAPSVRRLLSVTGTDTVLCLADEKTEMMSSRRAQI